MAVAPLLIIVDDTHTGSISYGPIAWNISTLVPWFNGTGHVPDFTSNNSGPFATLSMEFEGTSVAFFGITPPANRSQTLAVSIDGSESTKTSYNDPNPPSYRQWYQSPTLAEGSHHITLSNITGTSLDFAVVTVGNNTPLAGQVAIVDNEDPSITFEGNWKRNEDPTSSGQFPDGFPFHNSTEDSSTIGDSLTFRFTGQSAAIYGIFTWSNIGLITLTFTMDGSPLSKTYQVTSTTSQFQNHFGQQQNFQFFSYDFLQPGNHTLIVNVTDCVNQTFSFDYITFAPSFSTLAHRPNLTSVTDTGASDLSSSHHSISSGAIAGIVVAVIGAFLVSAFFSRRLRRKKAPADSNVNPFLPARNNVGAFPLSNRSFATHVSRHYTPIHGVDPDGPSNPTQQPDPELEDEPLPPSYDEITRAAVVR